MLKIDYRSGDRRAVLSWSPSEDNASWIDALRRLAFDCSEEASQEDAWRISLPWWAFASIRSKVLQLFTAYKLDLGQHFEVGAEAIKLLAQSKRSLDSHESAKSSLSIPESTLTARLKAVGFSRTLSKEQTRNVGKIAALSSAATFSVPGAGKTTEALASFFFKANDDENLIVIAPKNAFAAWDEQLADCMPHITESFVRLRGGREKISRALDAHPRFMLITYQQMVRVSDLIAAHCSMLKVHIFLDESHRIKSGYAKQTARSVLNLSHLPVGKLIMSGTPMPQSLEDLIPQFAFLYPEIPTTADDVIEQIRPVYVRTNKTELGLPPVTRVMAQLPMSPMQAELYNLMKFEVAREAATALSIPSKQAFRMLGRSVSRLLQFVSNPSLLAAELSFAHPDMLAGVLAEGDGPKMKYVLKRARALARAGNKVLIWSSFVRNVEYISERLSDLGAVYIHGGVDAGDEDDDESREGKIKLFHDDPNVRVMVANPAAASEGVSLHRVCHHALYLDRTFNAAHYLQSEDRIHRFGLPPGQSTTIEIVECIGTVDSTVRERLNFKIGQMALALEDSSLKPDPIPIDPNDIDDVEEYSTGLVQEDIEILLRDFTKGP